MTEGARFEKLGCYLIVERSGSRIKSIRLSSEPPDERSDLAEEIINHVENGGPSPKIELDLSGFSDFKKNVIITVMGIPRGQTMTYGEVARMAGSPGAARAVGMVMASNPYALVMPCHRVISKKGLGGYASGVELKRKLLELERQGSSTIF